MIENLANNVEAEFRLRDGSIAKTMLLEPLDFAGSPGSLVDDINPFDFAASPKHAWPCLAWTTSKLFCCGLASTTWTHLLST